MFISLFLLKMFPTICDETLCKFLFCTYEDSLNLIWSRISRGHVVDIYLAWMENSKYKNCNFRVLGGNLREEFKCIKLFQISPSKSKLYVCNATYRSTVHIRFTSLKEIIYRLDIYGLLWGESIWFKNGLCGTLENLVLEMFLSSMNPHQSGKICNNT